MARAARAANVSERTLRRWLQQPVFLAAYRAARRQVMEQAVAQLQKASSKAVATLVKNLGCGVPAAANVAAKTILELSHRGAELLDLEERLAAIEAQQEKEKNRGA
jgi:hypothetical protein